MLAERVEKANACASWRKRMLHPWRRGAECCGIFYWLLASSGPRPADEGVGRWKTRGWDTERERRRFSSTADKQLWAHYTAPKLARKKALCQMGDTIRITFTRDVASSILAPAMVLPFRLWFALYVGSFQQDDDGDDGARSGSTPFGRCSQLAHGRAIPGLRQVWRQQSGWKGHHIVAEWQLDETSKQKI